jgi:hypothetical protein
VAASDHASPQDVPVNLRPPPQRRFYATWPLSCSLLATEIVRMLFRWAPRCVMNEVHKDMRIG